MALEMDEQKMFFVLRCSPMKYGEEAEDIIFKQNGEVQAMGRTYHFDNVFPSSASNEEIYRTVIAEKMQLILEGENVSVIAYGAANTWKSHTIGTSPTRYVGSESEDLGLIQRTILDLFQKRRGIPFSMHVSFLEANGDIVYDLLQKNSAPCTLKENDLGVNVLGSTIKSSLEREFFSILERSFKNRKGRQSHLILNVILEITKGPLFNHRRVNFQFVDLSPRISPTDTCQNHALSLDFLSLRRVIQSFIWRKMYIPYRESMLTRLLKESLNRNCYAFMFACISEAKKTSNLRTLQFFHSARTVHPPGPELNPPMDDNDIMHPTIQEVQPGDE